MSNGGGCSHPVIFRGLCGVCGTPVERSSTKLVAVTHDRELHATWEEAEKVERESQSKLIGLRKLSLVLDLDHTLLHATNDPRAEILFSSPLIKDLYPIGLAPPPRNPNQPPISSPRHFVKLRPGLKDFLEQASKLFEMHIYTMGTKDYAAEIAKLIDPSSRFFASRIVSRDGEQINAKNVQRIFPVDDSMVIIIDDRLDVWGSCKNVIRIEPYHFFKGLPEVNELPQDRQKDSFSPSSKQPGQSHLQPPPPSTELSSTSTSTSTSTSSTSSSNYDSSFPSSSSTSSSPDFTTSTEGDSKSPDPSSSSSSSSPSASSSSSSTSSGSASPTSEETSEEREKKYDKEEQTEEKKKEKVSSTPPPPPLDITQLCIPQALEDTHLTLMTQILLQCHSKFYDLYDASRKETEKGKGKEEQTTKQREKEKGQLPDIKRIMFDIRSKILEGVDMAFTGVFPLGTKPQASSIWKLAEAFGARCHENLVWKEEGEEKNGKEGKEKEEKVTHLVGMMKGTQKVTEAITNYPEITVVSLDWLVSSFRYWRRPLESYFPLPQTPTGQPADFEKYVKLFYLAYADGMMTPAAASSTSSSSTSLGTTSFVNSKPSNRRISFFGTPFRKESNDDEGEAEVDDEEEYVFSSPGSRRDDSDGGGDSEEEADFEDRDSEDEGDSDDKYGRGRKKKAYRGIGGRRRGDSDGNKKVIAKLLQGRKMKAAAATAKRKLEATQTRVETAKKPKVDIVAKLDDEDEDFAALLENEFA